MNLVVKWLRKKLKNISNSIRNKNQMMRNLKRYFSVISNLTCLIWSFPLLLSRHSSNSLNKIIKISNLQFNKRNQILNKWELNQFNQLNLQAIVKRFLRHLKKWKKLAQHLVLNLKILKTLKFENRF